MTYGYGALANPMLTTLKIKKLEIWGLGSLEDLENQMEYWGYVEKDILKKNRKTKADVQFLISN
jgi:hypothetical protein